MSSFLKNAGYGLALGPLAGFKGVRRAADKGFSAVGGALKDTLLGAPEVRENVSTLRPEQEPLYNQAVNAGLQRGAGGAFGDSADYYRNLLGDDSADYNAFAAPAMRQYNEQVVPGLSEQFAGMGSGGLSSSGFRNAQAQGGVDLAERLGQIRANLRQAGAQGLQNIGQQGLQNYSQNMVTEQGTPGLLSQVGPALTAAAGAYFGGPSGAAAGYQVGNGMFGKSSPYGNSGGASSPQTAMPQRRPLPTFMNR